MHEINRPFLGKSIGFSVAVARVEKRAAACGHSEALRKIFPHCDGAEAFVEHGNRRLGACGWIEKSFQPLAVYGDRPVNWSVGGQPVSPRKLLENRFSTAKI
jgi:hypothetical protein